MAGKILKDGCAYYIRNVDLTKQLCKEIEYDGWIRNKAQSYKIG